MNQSFLVLFFKKRTDMARGAGGTAARKKKSASF
jgi:hypothetical protein